MKRLARPPISTKIEANKDKIYRTNDVYDLASLIFPNKNATDLRAAFLLIFLAIKYSREQRLSTRGLEDIRGKKAPEVSQKSLWKTRATMSRVGIIVKREDSWQFSSKFGKSLKNLAEKTINLMAPVGEKDNEEKEWFLLDHAKAYLKRP